jgi:biopolymer transport protein ExbB
MHTILARLMVCAALVGFVGASVESYAQAPATPAAEAPKAADAAPATPSAPAAAKPKTAAEENPFGFAAMLEHGDAVAKITLAIMVIMSVGSWYIIFTKLYEAAKIVKQAKEAEATFWQAGSVRAGAETLKEDSPFRFIAEKGLEATQKHTGLLGQIDLSEWITMGISRAIDNVQSRMGDGLAFLATVGSTAFTTRLLRSVSPVRRRSTKLPAPLAKRLS